MENLIFCALTRADTKISKTHRLLNKMWFSLSALLSVTATCASFASSMAEFFQFLDTVLREITQKFQTSQVIICAIYSFVFWFENVFLFKLGLAKYHCLR